MKTKKLIKKMVKKVKPVKTKPAKKAPRVKPVKRAKKKPKIGLISTRKLGRREDESGAMLYEAIYVQPPLHRSINVRGMQFDYAGFERTKRFFLSLPYVIFKIRYCKSGGFFVPKNLWVAFSVDGNPQRLFMPPLPNCHVTLEVCLYVAGCFEAKVEDMVKATVERFWTTDFTERHCWHGYKSTYLLSNLGLWETKTLNQPGWIPGAKELVKHRSRWG